MPYLRGFILCPILILLWFHTPAHAVETRLNGEFETYGAAYTQHKSGSEDAFGEFHFRPRLTLIQDEQLLVFVSPDIRQDSAGYTQGFVNPIPDRKSRRATAEAREAYLEYTPPGVRLRAGIQLFDWAVTDTVSPADSLSPRDWTDMIRWERRGLPAVDLRIGADSFAEAAFIPFFVPSRLPTPGSRWERSLQPGASYGTPEYPSGFTPQFALRSGATVNGFDVGASFFHGYSLSPFWKPELANTGIILHQVYRLENVYAVSAAKEIAGFNARLEIGHYDQHKADDFTQFVFGIDREYGNVLRPGDAFYLLLQYVDEYVWKKETPFGVTAIDLRRVFTRSVMGKIRYGLDDSREWCLKLEGSYNFEKKDSYVQPAVVWKRGNVEIEAGFDILSGVTDSFFGGYRRNDRGYLKGKFMF